MFWFPVRHCDYVGHSLLTAFYMDAYNYDNHTSQTKILEIMHEVFGVILPTCITDIIHCFCFCFCFACLFLTANWLQNAFKHILVELTVKFKYVNVLHHLSVEIPQLKMILSNVTAA